jgi:hypothetical protein
MRHRNLLWFGLPQLVRQWSRKVGKMINGLGVEVAEVHNAANFLMRHWQWPIFDGFDFDGRN